MFECTCTTGFTIVGSILALTIGCFLGAFIVSIIREEIQERKKRAQEQGEDLTRYVMSFATRIKMMKTHDWSNHQLTNYTRKYNSRRKKMEIK